MTTISPKALITQRRNWLDQSLKNVDQVRQMGGNHLAFTNLQSAVRHSVMIGLIGWRTGLDDPRPPFSQAIDLSKTATGLLESVEEIRAEPWQAFHFGPARFLSWLLNSADDETLRRTDCGSSDWVAKRFKASLVGRLLDSVLLATLHRGGSPPPEWGVLSERLAGVKKLRVPLDTYAAYMSIVAGAVAGNAQAVRSAVTESETLYRDRRADGYYSGVGAELFGGGMYNDVVVDFRLAAVLKVAEQIGGPMLTRVDTIHRWRW